MKKIVAVAVILLSVSPLLAQTTVKISADKGEHIINRNIYGHFAEHLGRCVYGGFYVGEDNQVIPNVAGVRTDVIEALKDPSQDATELAGLLSANASGLDPNMKIKATST